MKAIAVIDAAFGDSGKGLMTDYFASRFGKSKPLVVRHSGGAQAGHTVQTPEGLRHAFGHFGAGTFLGCPTYLSRFFIVNPLLWAKEKAVLEKMCVLPPLYVALDAPLTTPYDMLLNQAIETARSQRHGSCGVGINETIVRNQHPEFATYVSDIQLSADQLHGRLYGIWKRYVPKRLEQLGVSAVPEMAEGVLNRFVACCHDMLRSKVFSESDCLTRAESVIFEGAQGLLLDEDHHFFPHVTRSKTGIPNVLALCNEAGIKELDVCYVMRTYMTRHGAGPFPTEDPTMRFEDKTNAPNPWQGSLRFGSLDTRLIYEAITNDLAHTQAEDFHLEAFIAQTCADQLEPEPRDYRYGLGINYRSYGPTRNDVRAV